MNTTLFADDACLSFGHTSPHFIETFVNSQLAKAEVWFSLNCLALNISKTHYMLLHRRKKAVADIDLKLNGVQITREREVKYLGVILDEKLTWKSHTVYINNKLSKCLWALCKLRHYTNIETLKLIYYSLAHPHLQYCLSSWGGTSNSNLNPLLIRQKRMIRIIMNKPFRSPSSPLFFELKVLKLHELYKFRIAILMFNNKSGKFQMPQSLVPLSNLHTHDTRLRANQNYVIPPAHTNLKKTSFSYVGPRIWQDIPSDLKSSSEFVFKRKVKDFFLQNYIDA